MHDSKGKTVNRNLNLPPIDRHLGFWGRLQKLLSFF